MLDLDQDLYRGFPKEKLSMIPHFTTIPLPIFPLEVSMNLSAGKSGNLLGTRAGGVLKVSNHAIDGSDDR